MTSHSIRWLLPITLLASVAGLHAQPAVTGLSTLVSTESSWGGIVAAAVNNSGEVLYRENWDDVYLLSEGTATPIMDTVGLVGAEVHVRDYSGLNNAGQVIGRVYGYDDNWNEVAVAYVWSSSSGMTAINSAFGESYITVTGINNSGHVAGYSVDYVNDDKAFIWTSSGGMVELVNSSETPSGARAAAINDAGQVAGMARDGSTQQVVRWETDGGMTTLGTISDGEVTLIGETGAVVGQDSVYVEELDDYYYHAIVWDGVNTIDLGALEPDYNSVAYDINASGDIVGYSSGYDSRAFYYSDGVMYDLNDLASAYLVAEGSGIEGFISLEYAYGLNDYGMIVGTGVYFDGVNYDYTSFVLNLTAAAVPEPSTFAMLAGLGVLGLAALRRRH